MAFFKNKIISLADLLELTFNGQGPDEISFLGIIVNQKSEADEKHPNRIHHDLILHDGSKSRLHVLYISGFDDEVQYDNRTIEDNECIFFPKATTCFLPRLEISYVENDDIFCFFKGGDLLSAKMIDSPSQDKKVELIKRRQKEMADNLESTFDAKRKIRRIGSNRVCLILEMLPSSINQFVFHDEVFSTAMTCDLNRI